MSNLDIRAPAIPYGNGSHCLVFGHQLYGDNANKKEDLHITTKGHQKWIVWVSEKTLASLLKQMEAPQERERLTENNLAKNCGCLDEHYGNVTRALYKG